MNTSVEPIERSQRVFNNYLDRDIMEEYYANVRSIPRMPAQSLRNLLDEEEKMNSVWGVLEVD
jgi:hypothetical protein